MRQIQTMRDEDIRGENPLGMDVFSSDGQLIGRINGYVEEIEEIGRGYGGGTGGCNRSQRSSSRPATRDD